MMMICMKYLGKPKYVYSIVIRIENFLYSLDALCHYTHQASNYKLLLTINTSIAGWTKTKNMHDNIKNGYSAT